MIQKPLVGVDLDGVCADFMGEFIKLSRKLFHRPSKGWVQKTWDVDVLTTTEQDAVFLELKHTRNFWTTLEPLENTNALAKRHKEMNLFFVTHRFPTEGQSVMEQSQEWLWKHFGIRGAYVVCNVNKGEEAKALGLQYFLDDKPSNCTDIVENSPKTKVFLADATYNKTYSHPRVERVSNLNAYIKLICG